MAKAKIWNGSAWVYLDSDNASKLGGIDASQYALKTDVDAAKTEVSNKVGDLSTLTTIAKSDAVSAINEVKGNISTINTNLTNHTHTVSQITDYETNVNGKIDSAISTNITNKLGVANGFATLDATGQVPTAQIPNVFKDALVVNNIAGRDALSDIFKGLHVLVQDATGDVTVTSGYAEYICINPAGATSTDKWLKVSDGQSLDLVLNWANVQGKPTSAVADIDDAVAKRHAHANETVLDATTASFTTGLKTSYDGVIGAVGDMSAATTTAKTVVGAVNELNAAVTNLVVFSATAPSNTNALWVETV